MDLRLGLQLPRFNFPGVADDELFERLALVATTAEENGFDHVFVMDHFWQLPMLGPPELPMLEGYTLLAALAARTRTARLGTLVTGVTYRNPALLAKEVTALDVISGGRALLGIGAAWYEEEHRGLGFDFPPIKERFERLEDALHICRAMFTEERASHSGTHHSVDGAWNVPRPLQAGGPPVMVGGNGEKRTLRLAAQHADAANTPCAIDEVPRKLEVLAGHCADVGRDRAEVNASWLGSLVIAPTVEEARAKLDGLLRERGLDLATVEGDDGLRAAVLGRMVVGGPEECAAQVRDLYALGLDGVVFNLPVDGHDPETVALAAKSLQAL